MYGTKVTRVLLAEEFTCAVNHPRQTIIQASAFKTVQKLCLIIPSKITHRFEPTEYLFLCITSIRRQTNTKNDVTTWVHIFEMCHELASTETGWLILAVIA